MDQEKMQKVLSDKAYVESIVKLSPEDAAKSLQDKGVEVTAEDLVKVRDFIMSHKEELQNGELSEDALASVAGGVGDGVLAVIIGGLVVAATVSMPIFLW